MIDVVVNAALGVFRKELSDSLLVEENYPMVEKRVVKPLLYTECIGFDRAETQPANGLFAVDANFETRLAFPVSRTCGERKKARQLTERVVLLIEGSSFGLTNCFPAKVKSAFDDGLDPEVPTVETWAITWEMQVMLGELNQENDEIDSAIGDNRKTEDQYGEVTVVKR